MRRIPTRVMKHAHRLRPAHPARRVLHLARRSSAPSASGSSTARGSSPATSRSSPRPAASSSSSSTARASWSLRDGDGTVRAFHNLCRHRGSRLCPTPHGELGRAIQCPYHAWTYGLDGALRAAPNMTEVAGFDRAGLPAQAGRARRLAGLPVPEPRAGARSPSPRPCRRSRASSAPGGSPSCGSVHQTVYEVEAELEALLPQLQRVLPLPQGPSAPQQADALPQHRERPRRRAGPGRADVDEQPRGEHDEPRRALRGRPSPGSPPRSAGASTTTRSSRAPSCRSTPTTCWSTARSRSASTAPASSATGTSIRTRSPRRASIPQPAIDFWDLTNRQDWELCANALQGGLLERLGAGALLGAREPARRLRPAVPAGAAARRAGGPAEGLT